MYSTFLLWIKNFHRWNFSDKLLFFYVFVRVKTFSLHFSPSMEILRDNIINFNIVAKV